MKKIKVGSNTNSKEPRHDYIVSIAFYDQSNVHLTTFAGSILPNIFAEIKLSSSEHLIGLEVTHDDWGLQTIRFLSIDSN